MTWEDILCGMGGRSGVSEMEKENQGKRDDALAGRRGREGLARQGKILKGLGCSRVRTGCRSIMPL